jgi:hypothetical protein
MGKKNPNMKNSLLQRNFFWRNKHHFMIVGLTILYIFSASSIYANFILQYGKPIQNATPLPTEAQQVVYKLENLNSTFYAGEDQYEINGCVFAPTYPDSPTFRKTFILHSTTADLFFPTYPIIWPNLNSLFPQYKFKLDDSAFKVFIAKETLRQGNYKIGFLLESTDGKIRIYQYVDAYIERSPNTLRLIYQP